MFNWTDIFSAAIAYCPLRGQKKVSLTLNNHVVRSYIVRINFTNQKITTGGV